MSRLAVLLLVGCNAIYDTQSGPTFGGDHRSDGIAHRLRTGDMPHPDDVSEAGVLAALPLAVAQYPCHDTLCVETRPAWLPSGELLLAVGVESVRERPPVDMALALDASGSVVGSEDVRAAAVEVALERLNDGDSVAVWAFTGVAEPLVEPTAVTDTLRQEVRTVLRALDGLPEGIAPLKGECLTWEEVLERYDASESGQWSWGDWDDEPVDYTPLFDWVDVIFQSSNDGLGESLLSLGCTGGSAVSDGVDGALSTLPNGREERASRLVLVSDLQGELPSESVVMAADRGVGTSVLGVTASTDTEGMAQLAGAPGAHMLDAAEPSAALAAWDARFEAWVAPTSWGLAIELADVSSSDWTVARRVGTTDADGEGANSAFSSVSHGVLGLVLQPTTAEPNPPIITVTSRRLSGEEVRWRISHLPERLITTDWGAGEDWVALQLAWRVALLDAIAHEDQAAWEDLVDVREHPGAL